MQTITGKEIAERKSELGNLLTEILQHHTLCEAGRICVENSKQISLFHAWQAGIRLNKAKALIGHGNWEVWLKSNFKASIDTAEIYMRIDNQNPEMRKVKDPKSEHVRNLKFDTIRKYAYGLVPSKEQPQHKGNANFPRLVSFLNIFNEFDKVVRRHIDGLQRIDWDEVREESSKSKLYQTLQWAHGDAETPPFKP